MVNMEPHKIGGTMIDHQKLLNLKSTDRLTPELKNLINETRSKLKGCERRKFMAKVVRLMGKGGQHITAEAPLKATVYMRTRLC